MLPTPLSGPVWILRDCLASLLHACRGGLEQGGWLVGTRGPRRTVIYDARPFSGALRTPRALLLHRRRPPRALRDDVVGWFHSHPGGGPHLSRADVAVHRRLFPRGRGLALVVGRNEEGERMKAETEPSSFRIALYRGSPPRPVEALWLG